MPQGSLRLSDLSRLRHTARSALCDGSACKLGGASVMRAGMASQIVSAASVSAALVTASIGALLLLVY